MARKQIPSKERLMSSGAALFSEKGYAGVSVREICKHAKTSMNMIHHYFKNKDPRNYFYFENREKFSDIMLTLGNNVFEEDKFNQKYGFLPKKRFCKKVF